MRRRRFLALGLGAAVSAAGCGSRRAGPAGTAALGHVSVVADGEHWAPVAQVYGRALRQRVAPPAGHAAAVPGPATRITVTGLSAVASAEVNQRTPLLEAATPLARLTGEPEVVVVPAESRLAGFDAFAAALLADPAAIRLAGGPQGEADHVLFGLISQGLGADTRLVDYAGYSTSVEAAAALMAGTVAAAAGTLAAWRTRIDRGRVRVLAVSTAERVAGLDAPTLRECGVRVDFSEWCAAFGPPDMGERARLAAVAACEEVAYSEQWLEACRTRGWKPMPLAGGDFARWLASELGRTRHVLRDLGLLDTHSTSCGVGCGNGH